MGKKTRKGKKFVHSSKENSLFDQNKTPSGDEQNEKKTPKFSIDQLLDKAAEFIDTFEFEMAQKFCQRALEMNADNVRALQLSGTLLIELGQLENAKCCFGRAVELEPDSGHGKYMYLGQLLTGEDSVQYFKKGIELMEKELGKQLQSQQCDEACSAEVKSQKVSEVTVRQISQAHCSIAEIYLTDECFDEAAESECHSHLTDAISKDPENPEAHHLMASFFLSTGDKQKAKESLKTGLSLWLPQMKEAHESDEVAAAADPVQVCPVSYPARVGASKLLIELEQYDEASEVLELLLDEDDEVLEVWYLLGWSNYLQGDDYKTNARYYLKQAAKVASKLPCEDEDMIEHVQELLAEIGPGDDDEGGDEEDEDCLAEFDKDTDSEEETSAEKHEAMECS